MFFDPADEFPHEVTLLTLKEVNDGMGGKTKKWVPGETLFGFMDTPTAKEQLYAMQMSQKLDRYFYYPYGQELPPNYRIRFENIDYEIAGEGEDQGGMHEVMRMPLKKV